MVACAGMKDGEISAKLVVWPSLDRQQSTLHHDFNVFTANNTPHGSVMALPLRRQVRSCQLRWLRSSSEPFNHARSFWSSRCLRQEHESTAVQSPTSAPDTTSQHAQAKPQIAHNGAAKGGMSYGWARKAKPTTRQPKDYNGVQVEIDGATRALAPILLRDLCACSQCVDSSTRQKQFYTPDIPANIEAKTVSTDAGSISITWANDLPGYDDKHVTNIPLEVLNRMLLTGKPEMERPHLPRSLWDSATFAKETVDYEYAAYMTDDEVLLSAVKQLHTHGLLFVRNVPEDEESVVRLAERIGPLKTTFYGKTWDVRSVPDAKNVAYTSQNLGFHMDLMYMEQPPHLQLLHCIRSSSSGGASLFSDSFKAVQEIAQTNIDHFQTLAEVPVSYHYDHPGENYYHQSRTVIEEKPIRGRAAPIHSWSRALEAQKEMPDMQWIQNLNMMDFVSSVAWSPPFQGPFRLKSDPRNGSGSPNAALTSKAYSSTVFRWHEAAANFNKLIHREDHIHERMMKPGECVIFDNRRVLHARRAFDVGDIGMERWLKGGYIDKDPYMSKLKILRERFDA